MEHDHIKSGFGFEHLKPCPDCYNTPEVSFNPFSLEFKISCCGYVAENAEWEVALGVWNDFVEERISESNSAAEMEKEKTPNGVILQCPICGSALEKIVYTDGMLQIVCKSMDRCINIASKDHARLRALLKNEDWRSMAEEAKPCPRCGGDEIELWFDSEKFWIHCKNANCWAESDGVTSAEALAKWKEIVGDEPNVDAANGISRNGEPMEDEKEKEANAIIAPCPRCGKIPETFNVSRPGVDNLLISCCGVSKCRDEYYATIEAWNDYSVEHQLEIPAERSQDKISNLVENLREMLVSQNYGNSALTPPVLCPKMEPEQALLVRMSDKIARLASLASEKDRDCASLKGTLLDLAGCCILAIIAMEG